MTIRQIINKKTGVLSSFLSNRFQNSIKIYKIEHLGSGFHGTAYKATSTNKQTFILKEFLESGRNLEFPEDRIRESLLIKRTSNQIPFHNKIFDVVQFDDNQLTPIKDATPVIIMEEVTNPDYFTDLSMISRSQELSIIDVTRIKIIAQTLAHIHSENQPAHYYLRYLRDWFGNGILDLTNTIHTLFNEDEIIKLNYKFIEWEHQLSKKKNRCKKIHGEFFPGTITFSSENKLKTFDMRRIGAGEPADDVGSIIFNYMYQSIIDHNTIITCFVESINIFLHEYLLRSKDYELKKFLQVFIAYRCLICIHPDLVPIPLSKKERLKKMIFPLLNQKEFDLSQIAKIY